MKKIIDQVQKLNNVLGYVSSKKVIEILEQNKRKNKTGGKYCALWLEKNEGPAVVGSKKKIEAVKKFIDNFHTHQYCVIKHICFTKRKEYKKQGICSL